MVLVISTYALGLGRRFLHTCREEGVLSALSRTAGFLRSRLQSFGFTALTRHNLAEAQDAPHYLAGIWRTLAQEDAFHITASPAVLQRQRSVAMIGDLNLPQCRKYRVDQLAQFWRNRDVAFEFAHYEDVPRASRILQQATHLMEYRLQATPLTEMLRYEARRLRLPILYDIDDPLFSVAAYETYGNMKALAPAMKDHFVSEAPKYLSMMNGADVISVSTPGLQSHAALLTNRPVFVRRNFADQETLAAGSAAMRNSPMQDGIFRLAFSSGSRGHEVDLATIIDPLCDFLRGSPRRKLMILGHFDLNHLPAEISAQVEVERFTSYPNYLAALARADAAIMPLGDDLFNQCKSAVRVIDASAVGVPSVAAAVGDMGAVIAEDTGIIAADANAWASAFDRLSADPAGSARMGQRARCDLETRWCGDPAPHIIAPELLKWLA